MRYTSHSDADLSVIEQLAQEIAAFPLVDDFDDADAKPLMGADMAWEPWAKRFLPGLCKYDFAEHHRQAWDWFENLPAEDTPPALVYCVNRGGAKSGTFEACCVRLAYTLKRRFVLYISETQKQANLHVQAVRTQLERSGVKPKLTEFGQSAGWQMSLLRTANGFNVLALGLDSAARGIRFDEFRPDLIIADDLDGKHDTPKTTEKKLETLTESILPAGSPFCAFAFGQNVILHDGLMDSLVKGTAKWLSHRITVFVEAIKGFEWAERTQPDGTIAFDITGGESAWKAGQPLKALQSILWKIGLRAFLREYQHKVGSSGGGLWDGMPFRYLADDLAEGKFPVPVKEDGLPIFDRIVVAVDPSGSRRGDEAGIVAAGSFTLPGGKVGAVVLEDISDQMSPKMWAQEAVTLHRRLGANKLLCERNFGGELVEDNIKGYPGAPPVTMVSVTNGKIVRAEPIQQRYESGLVWHAKRLPSLEAQMTDWHPGSGLPSPGSLDAAVIALSSLFGIADHIRISGSSSWEALASASGDAENTTDDASWQDSPYSDSDLSTLSGGWGNW